MGGDSKTLMLLQLNPCGSHVEDAGTQSTTVSLSTPWYPGTPIAQGVHVLTEFRSARQCGRDEEVLSRIVRRVAPCIFARKFAVRELLRCKKGAWHAEKAQYVYMYVCMYVCMYVYIYIYIYIYISCICMYSIFAASYGAHPCNLECHNAMSTSTPLPGEDGSSLLAWIL